MRTFVRKDRRRIQEEGSSKYVTREYLRNLIDSGVQIRYVDFDTREDLIQNIYKGRNKRNASYEVSESDFKNGLGAVLPEFGDKKRKCPYCNTITVNRYRCSSCLDDITANLDGDFIYYNSSGDHEGAGADE